MSSRVRKTNDKNQQILKALLKEAGNSHCADCKTASHPRWASWNLGIFICIRCSGIHRSMGTHISRVKSVDLDTWTDEQIQSMVKWGNLKANQFWEAKLPGNNHIPDDSKIENFIRTKYDLKKWAASNQIPDPSTLKVDTNFNNNGNVQTVNQLSKQSTSKSDTTSNRRSLNSNLLDLEFGSPIAAPKPQQSQQTVQSQPRPSSTLESLTNTFNQPTPQQRQQHQPQQQQQQQRPLNTRPDLKKSILSLYSTPIASNSTPNFPAHNSLQSQSTSSLNGLNFQNTGNTTNSWNNNNNTNTQNQWASTTSSPAPTNHYTTTNTTTSLDDDLFKNVWN